MFKIDAGTGALSTTQPLDREATERYSLEVEAADGGSPALSTTVTVDVNVMDVNDNSPVFTGGGGGGGSSSYSVDVSEDTAPGSQVLQVGGPEGERTSETH